ncbi:UNVERIFIED_CONTAM: hypothetical protein PYX00_001694 [Menopon gallinae]|uniref:Zinc carboxypeptidase A 1 n=1 Tax=Menopon gallinae TaxID=328185 RepID=A0AAW2IDS4_9NEOP
MMKLLSIFAILYVIGAGSCEKARYDNYQVYSIKPRTPTEVYHLGELWKKDQFSFWNDPVDVNIPVDIMVAPHQRAQFEELLQEFKFDAKLSIPNVQALIDAEEAQQKTAPRGMEWKNYHTMKEIYDWLDELAKKYKQVKVVVGGKSYEGRQIKGIEINFGKNLTNVFIEAGIHAREWISPAATTWMINEILNSSSTSFFRQFNYLYFPLYNPDGYVYAWEKDRMWRKTRTPYKSGSKTCYGADPNRNWDFHWNEVGTSNDPCSEIYAGPKAFSEIETKSMANYTEMRTKTDRKSDLYLAYHSYSQMILYPWGYTTKPAPHNDVWKKIGNDAAKALASVYGTNYTVGPISTTIYKVSGSSIEWYYDKLKPFIPFVYELRDKGKYGFLLPPDQILPTAVETMASLEAILKGYKANKK